MRVIPVDRAGCVIDRVFSCDARFIVSFYILDRTLAVWEPRRNNSGREGGVFLERTRVPNPETGQAFTENDMQVGSRGPCWLHCPGPMLAFLFSAVATDSNHCTGRNVQYHTGMVLGPSLVVQAYGNLLAQQGSPTYRPPIVSQSLLPGHFHTGACTHTAQFTIISFWRTPTVPTPHPASLALPRPPPSPQVGAVLQVYSRGFQLLDADAFTLQYMEREAVAAPGRFPWADPSRVLARLADWVAMYAEQLPDRLRAELLAADRDGSGYIDKFKLYVSWIVFWTFHFAPGRNAACSLWPWYARGNSCCCFLGCALRVLQALLSGLGSDLGPHEVVTLVRQLGADRQGLLVEQLLVALGLAPPPPPQDVQPQNDQASC